MNRQQLDHLLRAAGGVTDHRRFVLVGSAAIFAWRELAPENMAMSREADLYAADVSEADAELIADKLENIGQHSIFDETHGYYADGVGPETAVLPRDWRDRSKIYESPATEGVQGIVPHPEDIALSKLCAGREKDLDWVSAAHRARLIDLDAMIARLDKLPGRSDMERRHILSLIEIARRTRA
jgi:hypothetical protein